MANKETIRVYIAPSFVPHGQWPVSPSIPFILLLIIIPEIQKANTIVFQTTKLDCGQFQ